MGKRPTYEELEQRIKKLEKEAAKHNSLKVDLMRIDAAVKSAGDAIGMATPEGKHFFQNKAFTKLFGYTVKEINVKSVETKIYKNRHIADEVFSTIKSGKPWTGEIEMKSKDGREMYVDLRADAVKDTRGKIIGLIGVHTEITEKKKIEMELRQSENRFRDIALCSGDWIWELDTKGRFTYCSERIIEVLGYSAREMLGKTPFSLMPKKESVRARKIFKQLSKIRKPVVNLENWNITCNGDKVCLLTNGVPLKDKDGKYCGYRGMNKDITNRKRSEELLRIKEEDLEHRTYELEEMNAALRVLLKHRDEDRKNMEENIVSNLKEMVFPFLDKLKSGELNKRQRVCLDIVQSHLDDIVAPFFHKLSSKYSNLTPAETKIAGLIKDGRNTKEIAGLLGSSVNAVKFHRANLRQKFGLQNQKINLRTYLISLPQ